MTKLDEKSNGYFAAKEGTLYPVLYRLEDAGYVQSNWESTEKRRGVPRKYYTITPKGMTHLSEAQNEFYNFINASQEILNSAERDF